MRVSLTRLSQPIYLDFTSEEWAALRANTPLTLTESDVEKIRGINVNLEVGNPEAVKSAVEAGLGVSIVSQATVVLVASRQLVRSICRFFLDHQTAVPQGHRHRPHRPGPPDHLGADRGRPPRHALPAQGPLHGPAGRRRGDGPGQLTRRFRSRPPPAAACAGCPSARTAHRAPRSARAGRSGRSPRGPKSGSRRGLPTGSSRPPPGRLANVREKKQQGRGRHAVDPAGMGQGCRAVVLELLDDLVGKAADPAEIETGYVADRAGRRESLCLSWLARRARS